MLRDQFLVDAQSLTKVSGLPFRIAEIEAAIDGELAKLHENGALVRENSEAKGA